MRHLFTFILIVTCSNVFGQVNNSLGIDDNPILTEIESKFFNELSIVKSDTFDFSFKKIAFITGNSGKLILSKSQYFKDCVKPWLDKGLIPQTSVIILTKEEKEKSGGYDAIILSWVKLFTNKQLKKTIYLLSKKN